MFATRVGFWYQPAAVGPLGTNAVAVSHSVSPNISVYSFNSSTGIGTKFADPSILPGGVGDILWSSDGSKVIVGGTATIDVYEWDYTTGFGTRLARNTGFASSITTLRFNTAGNVLAITSFQRIPYAFQWSNTTGIGTQYANPALLQSGTNVTNATISPDDGGFVVNYSGGAQPRFTGWVWSNSTGFGTQYALAASVSANGTTSAIFSPDSARVLIGNQFSGGTATSRVYGFNSSTGFGGVTSTSLGSTVATRWTSTTIPTNVFMSSTLGQFVRRYSWPGGSGSGSNTISGQLNAGGATAANGIAISTQNDAIAAAMVASPYIMVWPWTGSAFGVKYADPSTLPTGQGFEVAFNK